MRRFTLISASLLLFVCGVLQIDMAAQERAKRKRAEKQDAGTQTKGGAEALQTLNDELCRATYEATMSHYEDMLIGRLGGLHLVHSLAGGSNQVGPTMKPRRCRQAKMTRPDARFAQESHVDAR